MSTPSISVPAPRALAGREEEVDRYQAVKQYSVAKILGVWAAAALPMGVLAWIVAPALEDSFSGAGNVPMFKALLLLLTAGMVVAVRARRPSSSGTSSARSAGRRSATRSGFVHHGARRPAVSAAGSG